MSLLLFEDLPCTDSFLQFIVLYTLKYFHSDDADHDEAEDIHKNDTNDTEEHQHNISNIIDGDDDDIFLSIQF